MAIKTKVGAKRRLKVLTRRLEHATTSANRMDLTDAESAELGVELAILKSELLALGEVIDEIEADDAR